MSGNKRLMLLALVTAAAVYLSYRELTSGRGGFVGGVAIGFLLVGLVLIGSDFWNSRKS
jgi:hypothetical protein